MLRIHHSDTPVGNLRYVARCSCGWESVHAGDGAEGDAIADGDDHLLDCVLARPPEWDSVIPRDSA